ncbi:collagen-like protein [Aquimarina sp. 2304DJ70-9]|uniref:collagen-like protein n=1 Tax=Aquimarina penaris TaxID=3231044 RepID=UPI003462AC4F
MKKILFLLSLSLVLFSSCEGDQGPPGPEGPPGLIGEAFERTITFTAANEFIERVPLDPNIVDSDVILVYRLEAVDNNLDVWEPLPTGSVFFFNDTTGAIEGFLYYRFNFTVGDVDIILESDAPDLAGPEFTDNQTFRIVIVPADFATTTDIDLNDFNAVQSALNLEFN